MWYSIFLRSTTYCLLWFTGLAIVYSGCTGLLCAQMDDNWLKTIGISSQEWEKAKSHYPRLEDIKRASEDRDFVYMSVNPHGYLEYRHKKTGLVFVLIPSGTFWMGIDPEEKKCPDVRDFPSDEEKAPRSEGKENLEDYGYVVVEDPKRHVYLDAYLIAKYELINTCYLSFVREMGKFYPEWLDPESKYYIESANEDYELDRELYLNCDAYLPDRPIVGISWYDAQEFCKWAGLELPTEAQWERACRAGTESVFYWGSDETDIGEYEWYCGNSDSKIHRPGEKSPNSFGLYDMSGNVWEWCQDWYHISYDINDTINPPGPNEEKVCGGRVGRGGSYNFPSEMCTSGDRGHANSDSRFNSLGLRPAKSLFKK